MSELGSVSAPRVSVVVPCFNAEATLGQQLEALAGQHGVAGEWEVIVADNGSTDGSAALAEGFRDRLPGLRVVAAGGRGGAAHSRNVGAAAARGELLAFCDADDVVAPGWLAALTAALEEGPLAASRFEVDRLNPDWVRGFHRHPQEHGLNPYDYPQFLAHAGGCGLGVRRALFEELGGFDESLPALEDTDFCWRAQLAGHPLAFAGEAVVHVRFRHDLGRQWRQARSLGRYNVLIYKRYRSRGMPRLPLAAGLARWAKLLLTAPRLLAGRQARAAWLWQLGWRLGRLAGCLRYGVLAL